MYFSSFWFCVQKFGSRTGKTRLESTCMVQLLYNTTVLIINNVAVVRRSLESWWHQPIFRCVYADHLYSSLEWGDCLPGWPSENDYNKYLTCSPCEMISEMKIIRVEWVNILVLVKLKSFWIWSSHYALLLFIIILININPIAGKNFVSQGVYWVVNSM